MVKPIECITLTGAFILGWVAATFASKTINGMQTPDMYTAARRFARKFKSKEPLPEDEIRPVCGYLCLGRGGFGCIDKAGMYYLSKEEETK